MMVDKHPSTWGTDSQKLAIKEGRENHTLKYSTKHPIVLDVGLR